MSASPPESDASGRVALVTGSSRGIGRAIALGLADEGMRLVIHCRRETGLASELCAELAERGTDSILCVADLEDVDAITGMFVEIDQAFGRLDVLVANAAATAFKPIIELTPSNIDRTLSTVVRSFILLGQEASRRMSPGGRIVAISGMDTEYGQFGHGLLAASKSALDTLVKYMAVEFGPLDVTVNSVKPGFIPSDSSRMYLGDGWDAISDAVLDQTPIGRHLSAADVATVVTWLCSPSASSITGENLALDGGLRFLGGPWAQMNERLQDAHRQRNRNEAR